MFTSSAKGILYSHDYILNDFLQGSLEQRWVVTQKTISLFQNIWTRRRWNKPLLLLVSTCTTQNQSCHLRRLLSTVQAISNGRLTNLQIVDQWPWSEILWQSGKKRIFKTSALKIVLGYSNGYQKKTFSNKNDVPKHNAVWSVRWWRKEIWSLLCLQSGAFSIFNL